MSFICLAIPFDVFNTLLRTLSFGVLTRRTFSDRCLAILCRSAGQAVAASDTAYRMNGVCMLATFQQI